MNNSYRIVQCYGITKDPETNNFMMVMQYARYGSLRQHLNISFNSLRWENKLFFFLNFSRLTIYNTKFSFSFRSDHM